MNRKQRIGLIGIAWMVISIATIGLFELNLISVITGILLGLALPFIQTMWSYSKGDYTYRNDL